MVESEEENKRRFSKREGDDLKLFYRFSLDNIRRRLREAKKARLRLFLLLIFLICLERLRIFPRFFWMHIATPLAYLRHSEENSKDAEMWSPRSDQDFAPKPGGIEFCDGYTREEWDYLKAKNGLWKSRKDESSRQWKSDPLRLKFPARYQDYDIRPTMHQLMVEVREPYWRADAFSAIKLMTPPEVHDFLDHAYAFDLHDLRLCYAETTDGIISNIRSAALRWEARMQNEAEERKREILSELEISRTI